MGLIRFLLIFLISLSQVHLCEGEYKLPGGVSCLTCVELDKSDQLHAETDSLESKHGDCHDCCVKACDDSPPKSPIAMSSALSLDLAFCLPGEIEFLFPNKIVERIRFVLLESAPPTGPPDTYGSRAPPTFKTIHSSAGRWFVKA